MPNDQKLALSRRQVLGSLGAVGLASAGAGLGTSALFSDEESFEDNRIMAGTLDLKVGWEEHYSDPQLCGVDDPADGLEITRSDPGSDSYVGLPDPSSPVVWVHEDHLVAYMSNAAIEAFPDRDDDGEQEMKTSPPNPFRYSPFMFINQSPSLRGVSYDFVSATVPTILNDFPTRSKSSSVEYT
jgi:predicted ribosomally synthesized peptide with SipW-like signal peptide